MKKVVVYSTPTCPFCKNLKKYLDEKEVSYEVVDVTKERDKAKEVFQKTGHRSVPITLIDDEYVVGFKKDRINELLGL